MTLTSDYHQAPYHSQPGRDTAPGLLSISSRLWERIGEGREGRLSCLPPSTLFSITTPWDGHSRAPGKEQQEAAGSKHRVAQPGHHGENTKNKPKKSPRPRATAHILAGPQKVLNKGCFRFLWLSSTYFHYVKKTAPWTVNPRGQVLYTTAFVILWLGDMVLLHKNPLLKKNLFFQVKNLSFPS